MQNFPFAEVECVVSEKWSLIVHFKLTFGKTASIKQRLSKASFET